MVPDMAFSQSFAFLVVPSELYFHVVAGIRHAVRRRDGNTRPEEGNDTKMTANMAPTTPNP